MLGKYNENVIKNLLLTWKPKNYASFEILNNKVARICYQPFYCKTESILRLKQLKHTHEIQNYSITVYLSFKHLSVISQLILFDKEADITTSSQ